MARHLTNEDFLDVTIQGDQITLKNHVDQNALRLKIDALSSYFTQISGSQRIVSMHQRSPSKKDKKRFLVLGFEISDIFNALGKTPDGFVMVPEISVNVPVDFDTDPNNKDGSKAQEFRHSLLTQSQLHGRPSVHRQDMIVVDYDGYTPGNMEVGLMYVYEGESLIAIDAVDEVIDRGAYREILFKDNQNQDNRRSVCTPLTIDKLRETFPPVTREQREERTPNRKPETLADIYLRRMGRYL